MTPLTLSLSPRRGEGKRSRKEFYGKEMFGNGRNL